MLMRSLQPKNDRHLMVFPQTNIRALIEALYGIEDGLACGLWFDSSPPNSKGEQSSGPYRLDEVGAIGSFMQRRPPKSQHVSIRSLKTTYIHSSVQFSIDLPYRLSHSNS